MPDVPRTKALRAHLVAMPSVAALTAMPGGHAVAVLTLPPRVTGPRIVIVRDDAEDEIDLAGEGGTRTETIICECAARSGDQAEELADAVRSLSGYRGALGTGAASREVQGVFVTSVRDDYLVRLPADAAESLTLITVALRIY